MDGSSLALIKTILFIFGRNCRRLLPSNSLMLIEQPGDPFKVKTQIYKHLDLIFLPISQSQSKSTQNRQDLILLPPLGLRHPLLSLSHHHGCPAVPWYAGRLQGLCTCCSLCLENFPPNICTAHSLFSSLLTCHLLRKDFAGYSVLNYYIPSLFSSPPLFFSECYDFTYYTIISCLSFLCIYNP